MGHHRCGDMLGYSWFLELGNQWPVQLFCFIKVECTVHAACLSAGWKIKKLLRKKMWMYMFWGCALITSRVDVKNCQWITFLTPEKNNITLLQFLDINELYILYLEWCYIFFDTVSDNPRYHNIREESYRLHRLEFYGNLSKENINLHYWFWVYYTHPLSIWHMSSFFFFLKTLV